ncbi:hypothetical protein GIW30_28135 [Pseudomonas sp. PA-5-4G]|nr:hypothetical protein [Pseudomonas sp. PA-5-4H]MCF5239376.1 hypothetical protein [Pseudomonas sp. PA-5-4G]MCF5249670.1 hypothetical protein [Pseudomonas sp. PA-5-4B]MCF5255483.1 hypothetical protein [Pseudomonas sp. PA-5-4B]MCF5258988.1 hypothetical protein [Pseudomonas sp. PA-5-4A]
MGMQPVTLRVTTLRADAERPERHSHAERGNDLQLCVCFLGLLRSPTQGKPARHNSPLATDFVFNRSCLETPCRSSPRSAWACSR